MLAVAVFGLVWPASGQGSGEAKSRFESAVRTLNEEARPLQENRTGVQIYDRRPHPALAQLPVEAGEWALAAIDQNFAGEEVLNGYVRWHLMWLVNRWLEQGVQRWRQTGERPAASRSAEKLLDLLSKPEALVKAPRLNEELLVPTGYDPKQGLTQAVREASNKLTAQKDQLKSKTTVRVGIPPFDRTIEGQAALAHLSGAQRTEAEAAIRELRELNRQYKVVRDPIAQSWNRRRDLLNVIQRKLRADLTYSLLQSGQKNALQAVVNEIDSAIKEDVQDGIEAIGFLYLASYDGLLALQGEQDREYAGRDLERLARRYEGYQASKKSGLRSRDFSEYAFHMVQLLQDPVGLDELARTRTPLGQTQPTTQRPSGPIRPEQVSAELVRDTLDRATGRLGPIDGDLSPTFERMLGRDRHTTYLGYLRRAQSYAGSPGASQEANQEAGNWALLSWALLNAGESYQHPMLLRRIHFVLAADTPSVFERSMRLQMLSSMPVRRFGPWVRRDALWFNKAMMPFGGFPEGYANGKPGGEVNTADSFYGLLALHAASKAEVEINRKTIGQIDAFWRSMQDPRTGGFGFLPPADSPLAKQIGSAGGAGGASARKPSLAMTAIGTAALSITERQLRGDALADVSKNLSPELQAGLAYLDKNFTLQSSDTQVPLPQLLWTIQQVGRATGYRTFNGIDWYRAGAAELISRQKPSGVWNEEGGFTVLPTGFAILFLSNAADPIAFAKLRFDGEWNNRPHDLLNVADFIADTFESPHLFQVFELSQSLPSLLEAPILYLASDKPVKLTEAQADRLREYLLAGGMLVTNPESTDPRVAGSFRDLFDQLKLPGTLEDLPESHEVFSIHRPVKLGVQAISNGVRPLVVHFEKDAGRDLQENKTDSESFRLLTNLYLYAVGADTRRDRLHNDYLVKNTQRAQRRAAVAVVSLNGNTSVEPNMMPQLDAFMTNTHGLSLDLQKVEPEKLPASVRFAFLPVLADTTINEAQAQALRTWVEKGGTLLIDAMGGTQGAVDAGSAIVRQMYPDRSTDRVSGFDPLITGTTPMPAGSHDLSRVQYRRYTLYRMQPSSSPALQAVYLDNRPAVLISAEDLTSGLAGLQHWGIVGYAPESARKIVANLILSATR